MTEPSSKYWAVIPAAGVGRRFGGDFPKQYQTLLAKPVARWTLERLLSLPEIEHCVVALSSEDDYWPEQGLSDTRITITHGGAERADSVRFALQALEGKASPNDWVLVHDIARPCVRPKDMKKLMMELASHPVGGILAAPVADTIKRVTDGQTIVDTVDRSQLWAAFTPQMFRYGLLLQALESARQNGVVPTDEAAAIEALGHSHQVVEGQRDNIKITRVEDLAIAAAILKSQSNESQANQAQGEKP